MDVVASVEGARASRTRQNSGAKREEKSNPCICMPVYIQGVTRVTNVIDVQARR